jgi:predicted nucleic acid-binding protein
VRIIIDASALVAFVTNEPAAPEVAELLQRWDSEGAELSAPALARYEIANALAKQAAAGNLRDGAIDEAWEILDDLPIVYHPLSNGPSVVRATLDLQRRSAYDAAYLALAEDLGADLWTLDGPLARNASARGYQIHLIEPHPAEERERS